MITNAPEDAAEVVGALIDHPAVRHINFTGSTRVGRIVAERAARHLKPVLLELGGKAPLIVLDDADIDAAVNAAAFGAFMNQGQICMSTERIVVDEKVADEFVKKLSAKAAGLPRRRIRRWGPLCWARWSMQNRLHAWRNSSRTRCKTARRLPPAARAMEP